jgi:hypothetical protein
MRRAETSPGACPVGHARLRRWPGFLAGLGVILLALGAACADRTLAALPAKVREALDRAGRVYERPLKGARWSEVHQLGGTDHPVYQLQGTNERGNKVEMEVTSAGRIIEVEEHGVPLREVPSAVTEALKAKMPEFKPTLVEAIYQAEQTNPACYGFEGKDAEGRLIEIYISADGKAFLN